MTRLPRLLAAAALAALATAAPAHRQWLLPSGTVFSGTDSWVTVDSAVSNDLFYADHQPGRLEGIKVWQPDGTPGQIQNGSTGRYRSVFDVKLDKPGTWKIGSEMSNVMGSFKVDGVEKRIGRRGPPPGGMARPGGPGAPADAPATPPAPPLTVADIPANATDVKLTEVIGRNEIFVTTGEPTQTVFKPTGKGLELSPITHPDELVAGEATRFRFLVDGKPAANLKVTVVPGGKRYRDAEGAMELTTGADGVLSVTWPNAGMYWLNATTTDANSSMPRVTQRRLSYTTTVEVMTP
ncbi:DUF4198 domain-containing protein [Sphingomonas jatrophae]|uniref:Uncharacterized conserved protein, contains GH25 family domain n=1 Tax=Sphingomonas jatrophae TaxID=1166337 RepID=A0A1I6MBV0_9SPHN|nr:DUF4198 domain-containing protein [Sphingomonas jatrophae]SFS13087.1 Uncharacterized conserved protein, contains GH25 family domain [Sphingomonas jatrophae]